MSLGNGSIYPNVLPLDAFVLSGEESASERIMGLKEPWRFGSAITGAAWVSTRDYLAGDIVWSPADKLTYIALVDNSAIEPDYSDAAVEGVTWEWIAGAVSDYVPERGYWLKLPDGTLMQWYSYVPGNKTFTAVSGGSKYTVALAFPVDFFTADYAIACNGDIATGFIEAYHSIAHTISSVSIEVNQISGAGTYRIERLCYTAIGRWKA